MELAPGFYWIRFIGEAERRIAEYSEFGHWYICGVSSTLSPHEFAIMSTKLEPPG